MGELEELEAKIEARLNVAKELAEDYNKKPATFLGGYHRGWQGALEWMLSELGKIRGRV